MGYLEEKLYNELPFLFDVNFATYIKENWKRYLDDCFIFWTKSKEELQTFHSTITIYSIHQSIKITIESSTTHLPFLDILIIKEEEKIKTVLYCKPTDTHQYLSFNSSHLSHTKRNIPFNLARGICTIVSENDTKKKRLYELKIFLKRQRYPEGLFSIHQYEKHWIFPSTNLEPRGIKMKTTKKIYRLLSHIILETIIF